MPDRILKHLPYYYVSIDDFVKLAATQSEEIIRLEESIEQLFRDQFVLTSSLGAIKKREQMLGIQAEPNESLNFRRRRIVNRYQTKPPFTIRYLQQQLDTLVGPGLTIVDIDYEARLLTVTANIDNASVFQEVIRTIETIKPANIVYQQNTALNEMVEIEEQIKMQQMTWNYNLSSIWKLGESPFITLGTEVIVR